MSLLDDVSIVVTPNGYKAGELYAVVPVPTEGAELVTNGDFATADLSSFNTTYATQAIVSEELKVTLNTANGYGFSYVSFSAVIGRSYRVQVDAQQGTGSTTTIKHNSGITIANEDNAGSWSYDEIGVATATSCAIRLQAYGDNGDYAIFDNVSVKEYTSADMDVTRATAATRVDENGLVNYAEVIGGEEVTNGDFATDTDWTKGSAWSISGNNANFDDSTNSGISQSMVFTASKTYKVDFEITSGSGSIAFLSSNGATTYVSYATYGVGTYSVEFNYTTGSGFGIFGSSFLGGAFSIDNVSVKEVTRDNVPRIDYTGGGCPHILAEPQRTNLVTYSSDFSNAAWTKSNSTIATTTETVSPDGTENASKLTVIAVAYSGLYIAGDAASNKYSMSVFAKKGDKDWLYFVDSNGTTLVAWFNISDGTLGTIINGTATINDFGNGWYRCTYSDTNNVSNSYFQMGLSDANSAYIPSSGGYAYIWGSCREAGSYATSYIPTSGSTVTRNQDIFTRDGIGSLINSTEGVFFVEVAMLSDDLTNRFISISNGSKSERVEIGYSNVSNKIFAFSYVGNVLQCNISFILPNMLDYNKIALKYKLNDFALWVNGVEVGTDLVGSVSTSNTINKLAFDEGDGTDLMFSKVKQLQVYKTALTDEQLLQLTGESGTDFYESYAEMASALTYTIQ